MTKNQKSKSSKPKIFATSDVLRGSIIGGPWVAAYMFYKNFKAIKQTKYAVGAVFAGALLPVVLLLLSYYSPRSIQFPTYPVYLVLVFVLVEYYQKAIARAHVKANGDFYPKGKAIVATLIFLALYLTLLDTGTYLLQKANGSTLTPIETLKQMYIPNQFNSDQYNEYGREFYRNDDATIVAMNSALDEAGTGATTGPIEKVETALRLQNSNFLIIDKVKALPNLPNSQKTFYEGLERYTHLRIEQLNLLKKSISTGVGYPSEYNALESEINKIKR